jgi:hypothetical protein
VIREMMTNLTSDIQSGCSRSQAVFLSWAANGAARLPSMLLAL